MKKRGSNNLKNILQSGPNKKRKNRKAKLTYYNLKKLQSEFITSTSHQFLTPLSTLNSSVELLEFYISKENFSRQREIINRIKKSMAILTETLSRITEFYKYHSVKQNIILKKIQIRKFINELLQEIAIIIGDSHIIIVNIQNELNTVKSDEFILKQILLNLINNAVKFSPAGGQIRLDVSKNQKEIQFSIKDEGIGISKNDLKKLFEPFFRGENAVSIPGIGLGLTIVKKFTGLINAKVKCLSKINEGSEFILLIPDEK